MALFYDRIGFETASTGTGAITAGSAIEGMRTFAQAGASDGETVRYLIEQGTAWELVEGVLSSSASVLSRAATLESSNGGSPIDLASGGAQVYCVPMARDVSKTATTLTHTAGAISLDVQAADVFRFEADDYTAPEITVLGALAGVSNPNFNISSLGLQAGDGLLVLAGYARTASGVYGGQSHTITGMTEKFHRNSYGSSSNYAGLSLFSEVLAGGKTTLNCSSSCMIVAIGLRNIDPALFDTAVIDASQSYAQTVDFPDITTVTENALVIAGICKQEDDHDLDLTGYTELGQANATDGSTWAGYKLIPSAGAEDPGVMTIDTTNELAAFFTAAIRPAAAVGELDYTITFSNIPASGVAEGKIDIELKTDTGSVAFAGGTVTWRGTEPAFDAVGHYLIGFIADASGITLWREG